MNNILDTLSPLLISWFIVNFTPGQSLIDYIYEYIPSKLKFTREYLNCFKCVSFWLTLIITLNPIQAIAFSMIAFTYNKIMSSLKIYF